MKISVAIPVYRSERTLPELVKRLLETIGAMGHDAEIVCVDDRSPDGSWAVLTELKAKHAQLKIVRLVKNAGQHNALLCALTLTTGDVVITMDDDLQHPPEEIPNLVDAVREGVDLVIGAYDTKKHSKQRNVGGALVDAALRRIFRLEPTLELTSFRALSKALVDRARSAYTVYPYVSALLLSQASSVANVRVRHEPRREGRSNYDMAKSLRLVLNLVLTYSSYPAILISSLCAFVFLLLFVGSGGVLWLAVGRGVSVPGWTSTILAVTLLNALVLLGLALVTFYISRIYIHMTGVRSTFAIERVDE